MAKNCIQGNSGEVLKKNIREYGCEDAQFLQDAVELCLVKCVLGNKC